MINTEDKEKIRKYIRLALDGKFPIQGSGQYEEMGGQVLATIIEEVRITTPEGIAQALLMNTGVFDGADSLDEAMQTVRKLFKEVKQEKQ